MGIVVTLKRLIPVEQALFRLSLFFGFHIDERIVVSWQKCCPLPAQSEVGDGISTTRMTLQETNKQLTSNTAWKVGRSFVIWVGLMVDTGNSEWWSWLFLVLAVGRWSKSNIRAFDDFCLLQQKYFANLFSSPLSFASAKESGKEKQSRFWCGTFPLSTITRPKSPFRKITTLITLHRITSKTLWRVYVVHLTPGGCSK